MAHTPVPTTRNALRGKLREIGNLEGMTMDPDLDPNLQHWQDRLDNFQWVVGSLSGLLDSVPT